MPFPTALVATVGHQTLTRVLLRHDGRGRAEPDATELVGGPRAVDPRTRPRYRDHVVGNAVIAGDFVLALGVALLLPSVGIVALLLLLLTTPPMKLIRRRR